MSFEKIKIVVDTNVLLNNPEILLDERYDYSISYTTLQELDKLKSDKDLNFPARHSIKLIFELLKENNVNLDIPLNCYIILYPFKAEKLFTTGLR